LLPVADRLHEVNDDPVPQIGTNGNERWTSVKAESAGRQLVNSERNQRLMRLGNRWESLEDTLSVLAERASIELRGGVLDPREALFAEIGS
jgi:hypothetical protein